MMKCLYCGKPIDIKASAHEKEHQWHSRCLKKFFGTDHMPYIDISEDMFMELANETFEKGVTVPGVQKKLSLHLSKDNGTRLTIVDYPAGYILKPQTEEYEMMPEFEYLAMSMAEATGIRTVLNGLIRNSGTYAYITKRADRNGNSMYGMEDFCQLAERLTGDKYKGSYEKCSKIITRYSSRAGLDNAELFLRIVFSFVTGNSDMHLKNFSLIEIEPGGRTYRLSPAYDMLPVNVILPEDKDQMALTLNGKRSNLKKVDFLQLASNAGIAEAAAEKMIKKVCSMENIYLKMCDESYLTDEFKQRTRGLIQERITILKST